MCTNEEESYQRYGGVFMYIGNIRRAFFWFANPWMSEKVVARAVQTACQFDIWRSSFIRHLTVCPSTVTCWPAASCSSDAKSSEPKSRTKSKKITSLQQWASSQSRPYCLPPHLPHCHRICSPCNFHLHEETHLRELWTSWWSSQTCLLGREEKRIFLWEKLVDGFFSTEQEK